MLPAIHLPRRRILAAMAGGVVAGVAAPALAQLAPTPSQGMGPFYPREFPADRDSDLTQVAGRSARAEGELLLVVGRVLDRNGAPVPGALIEIWQTNARGRYEHPRDRREDAPYDPNFQGYGVAQADAAGAYRFRTIKPGTYTGRPRHIHFQVWVEGRSRLVTQMYFPGDPSNALESHLSPGRRGAALIGRPTTDLPGLEPGAGALVFDIVLG